MSYRNTPRRLSPATTYPTVVGQVLRELRRTKDLQQAQLADTLAITQSAYSRIESGAAAPTVEQLALLAHALGVSPGEVLRRADEAAAYATDNGVQVLPTRSTGPLVAGLLLIGGAAVGALVGAALARGFRKKK